MKKMTTSSFKRNCQAVIDGVRAKRETVVITNRGTPVAKLVPVTNKTDAIYGFLTGKGSVVGDIISPVLRMKSSK